ncbi:MAG: hypothetical protein ACE5FP_09245, partial [Gemmatimonadota bacterium]
MALSVRPSRYRWRVYCLSAALAPTLVTPAPLAAQSRDPEAKPTAARVSSEITSPRMLADRIDRILEDPALARAHVGLTVQVAETG